ncbi:helix-turn-helix domain-containing protein [Bacteroidia bacterium]|nr:helix-turn-helix domain-containing protein [Bacteroidia bacterium]
MTKERIDIETSYLPTDLLFRIVRFEDKMDYNALKLHRHNYLEIFMFNKGGGTHLIDFQEYEIKDRQLHFAFPNQIHLVKRSDDANGFVILFKADFLRVQQGNPMQEFYAKMLNSPIVNPSKEQRSILESIFGLLKNEYEEIDAQFNSSMLKYYLNAFLIQCLRYKSLEQPSKVNLLDKDHQICNQLTQLVETCFKQQESLEFYEDQLNIGYKKLSAATKKVYGKSPKAIINERLLLEIKRRLLYTTESIKEIAYEFSFKEPSHLTKFFGRYHKSQSPVDFRTN